MYILGYCDYYIVEEVLRYLYLLRKNKSCGLQHNVSGEGLEQGFQIPHKNQKQRQDMATLNQTQRSKQVYTSSKVL